MFEASLEKNKKTNKNDCSIFASGFILSFHFKEADATSLSVSLVWLGSSILYLEREQWLDNSTDSTPPPPFLPTLPIVTSKALPIQGELCQATAAVSLWTQMSGGYTNSGTGDVGQLHAFATMQVTVIQSATTVKDHFPEFASDDSPEKKKKKKKTLKKKQKTTDCNW